MTNHYEANPEGRSRSRVRVGVQEASGNLIFDGGLVNFFFFQLIHSFVSTNHFFLSHCFCFCITLDHFGQITQFLYALVSGSNNNFSHGY